MSGGRHEVIDVGICIASLLADPMKASTEHVALSAKAAFDAGFSEASVWSSHLEDVASSGLQVTAVEGAVAWAGADAAEAAAEAESMAALVGEHGVRIVVATAPAPACDVSPARDNLALLADRLSSAGACVAVEFVPGGAVADLATAWALVEPLDAAVGLVIDSVHLHRQQNGPDLDRLRSIPGERIASVQLADVPAAATPAEAAGVGGRLLPGAGAVDLRGLLGVLREIGAAPFYVAEVLNPRLVLEIGEDAAAVAVRASARAVLGRHS